MTNQYELLIFAVLCFVVSIGFQTRAVWCWYLGWVMLFLTAAYRGSVFFELMDMPHHTEDQMRSAILWLVGAMILWVPVAVWWSTMRSKFGKQPKRKPKQPPPFTNVNSPVSHGEGES